LKIVNIFVNFEKHVLKFLDTCGTYSEVYAFADNAKFFRHILTADDRNDL